MVKTGLRIMAEYGILLVTGGALYCTLEMLWRGRTHWTMAVCGGVCFLLIYLIHTESGLPLLMRCTLGTAAICSIEFLTGYAVNIRLGWGVWDYSGVPGNIMGQICLPYAALWFVLCLVAAPVSSFIKNRLIGALI